MKIPASIRRLYDDQLVIKKRLKDAVDARMAGLRSRRWHYESRLKEMSSFALKVESGRFEDPAVLEDFFACTLVVVNATEIRDAEDLINEHFVVKERRPPSIGLTHKSSDSFPFDDLRLFVALREEPAAPPTDLFGIVFEVQIKTFLQHAWSIATHDLLYKTDDANWSKERIAYQIRAMLEHAEVSIQEAGSLAACSLLAKEDRQTEMIKRGIALLRSQWSLEQLPRDLRQLAANIENLRIALGLEFTQLETIIDKGKFGRGGIHPTNLSPYATVVQYLFDVEPRRVGAFLNRAKEKRKIVLAEEVDVPAEIKRSGLRNAVVIGGGRQQNPHVDKSAG